MANNDDDDKPLPPTETIVGWDSEYETDPSTGEVTPLSYQFFVLNKDGTQAENIVYANDKKFTFRRLLEVGLQPILAPGDQEIRLVAHFGYAEFSTLADGLEVALENNLSVVSKKFFSREPMKIGGFRIRLADTNLLVQTSLEEIGNWIGLEKNRRNSIQQKCDASTDDWGSGVV